MTRDRVDTNEEFDRLMASVARVRFMPLWEGPVPVAPGTWPRAAAVFADFARARREPMKQLW
ncbi:hypothetical protein ACFWSP_39480 [Streptomyces sp. NPDC058618]|uniref:hypothetical protein n=1 Tax=Streptomyces sp. NPDC058618 TaxID=3346558 RepID=UPI0036537A53